MSDFRGQSYGLFTLAMFVSETLGNSDTRQSHDCTCPGTLGKATQIGSFLFGLHRPKWPRQVQ